MSHGADTKEYSILRGCGLRPLHVAVAQRLVSTEPDDPRWPTLLRLYKALPAEERTQCKAALVAIDA